MLYSILVLAAAHLAAGASSSGPAEPPEKTIEPAVSQVLATAATATPLSPKSDVPGVAFDRFIQVWLENTDYSAASGNPDQKWLASEGITLTNYYATTHPSEPNYAAVVSGDNFGMDNDDFHSFPPNISTVVDLLDTKGISWAEYQEGSPYPGFQGFNWSNQETFANNYVRKHDPLILFSSVTENATRLSLIKNFTELDADVKAKALPQWSFVTPNMTDDGHDTNITFASSWERAWLAPLLNNSYFTNNTLVLLTFDEVETYTIGNKILAILLGGAVPEHLKGTTDDTFYNHYSSISSVSANWGLPSLGRWDCNANVFQIVANKTGWANSKVDTKSLFFNASYPGPVSSDKFVPGWPVPNTTAKCASGKGVLSSVVSAWGKEKETYDYTNVYPYDAAAGIGVGGLATVENGTSTGTGTTSTGTATTSASPSASSKGASATTYVNSGVAGMVALAAIALAL